MELVARGLEMQHGKLKSLRHQQGKLADGASLTEKADRIVSNLHQLPKSATRCTVKVLGPEGEDTGKQEILERAVDRSWNEEAERLYKDARRSRRGQQGTEALLASTSESVQHLEECLAKLKAWSAAAEEEAATRDTGGVDAKEVFRMRRDLKKRQLLPRLPKAKKSAVGSTSRPAAVEGLAPKGVRTFASPNGLAILVGRSQAANDRLSMQMAKKTDLWMHAEGPGAHVLLRCAVGPGAKRVEPAAECLQAAADLTAHFSKQSRQAKVKVHVANPADVTKPRGSKPGSVALRQAREMLGRPRAAHAYLTDLERQNLS